MRNDLYHASGWTKKDHKYVRKEGNRYIYPEDLRTNNEAARKAAQPAYNRKPARDVISRSGVKRVDHHADRDYNFRTTEGVDKYGRQTHAMKGEGNYIFRQDEDATEARRMANYDRKDINKTDRSNQFSEKRQSSIDRAANKRSERNARQLENRKAAANGKVINPSYTLTDKDGNKIARLQSKDKVSSPNQADYKQYSKEKSNEQKRKKAAGNNGRERFFEEGNGFSGNQPSQQSARWRSSWYKGESIAKKNEQEAKRIKNGKASIPSSVKEAQKLEKRIKGVHNSKSKIPTSDINKINKEVKKAYDKRINKIVERADPNDSASDSFKKGREVNAEFSKYAESAKPWLKPDSDIRKAHKKSSTSSNANKPVKATKEYYEALRSNTKNEKEFNDYLDKHNIARPDGSKPTTKNAQKVETWDNSPNIETWDNSKNIKTWDDQTAKKSTKNQKGHFTLSENGETIFVPDDNKTEKRVSKGKQIVNKIKNVFSKKKK